MITLPQAPALATRKSGAPAPDQEPPVPSFTRVHLSCRHCGEQFCVVLPEGYPLPRYCFECRHLENG